MWWENQWILWLRFIPILIVHIISKMHDRIARRRWSNDGVQRWRAYTVNIAIGRVGSLGNCRYYRARPCQRAHSAQWASAAVSCALTTSDGVNGHRECKEKIFLLAESCPFPHNKTGHSGFCMHSTLTRIKLHKSILPVTSQSLIFSPHKFE